MREIGFEQGLNVRLQCEVQPNAWRMARKRSLAAGIVAPIGNHRFRATGITAYLANGGAGAMDLPRGFGAKIRK